MKKISYLFGIALLAGAMVSCTTNDNPVDVPVWDTPITYDFAAAAAAGENPGNKNGSAANGQAFYGWESESKTDSKRQDYKGYEWAEGSVLPEECHVWRRSDRINNNVKNGGLYCPNNREMAIDGLDNGDIVQIYYDATNAADGAKEIVWAVAVDAEGNIHGTTATIGGAAAESGKTAIVSGQRIYINEIAKADNSETGYIVFKVTKGMVITKVVINKAVKDAE